MISEKLPQQNLKYTYTYDTSGNIRTVETTNTKTNKTTTDTYEYTDSDWKDLLTSYNGTAITYDAIDNPLSYNNGTAWKFTWENAHDLATACYGGLWTVKCGEARWRKRWKKFKALFRR